MVPPRCLLLAELGRQAVHSRSQSGPRARLCHHQMDLLALQKSHAAASTLKSFGSNGTLTLLIIVRSCAIHPIASFAIGESEPRQSSVHKQGSQVRESFQTLAESASSKRQQTRRILWNELDRPTVSVSNSWCTH